MPDPCTFEVPGPPVPKQRPRRAPSGHFYTPKRTTDYEEAVAWAAKAARLELLPGVAYGVKIDFYVSTYKRDVDNMAKSVLDGLQRLGDGWNDNQVRDLQIQSHGVVDGGKERAVVTVYRRAKWES